MNKNNGKLLAAVIAMLMVVCAVAVVAMPSEAEATPAKPTAENNPFADVTGLTYDATNGVYTPSQDVSIDLSKIDLTGVGSATTPMDARFDLSTYGITLTNSTNETVTLYINYSAANVSDSNDFSKSVFRGTQNDADADLTIGKNVVLDVTLSMDSDVTSENNHDNHVLTYVDVVLNDNAKLVISQATGVSGVSVYSGSITANNGTTVELNSISRITYPALFTGGERRVRLEGEAMFDVQHDGKLPFIVETYACDIEVHGTRFNVIAEESAQEFSTALFEGSVAVMNKVNDEQILMEPNTIVQLKNGHLHLSDLKSRDNYLWTDGIISFGGDDFGQIIDKLRRYYDVNIEIQRETLPEIRYKRLKVRTSEGVDHILRILQRSSDFTYEYNDLENKIIIR